MIRAIPLADLPRLGRLRARTRRLRLALVAAVVALILGVALAALRPATRPVQFLPHGTDGIVVLDLSASISSDTFQRIGATLRELAASGGRYGLVAFSDVAYHALPPGTPAVELGPYARFFTLPATTRQGFLPQFPTNPWTASFSGGTRISAGLGLALETIREERLRRPGVVLVSDLDDDPGDLQNLASVALAYRQLRIPVRIVALNPQPADERLFGQLLAGAVRIEHAPVRAELTRTSGGRFPLLLAGLALLVALALAAFELWTAQLTWGEAA